MFLHRLLLRVCGIAVPSGARMSLSGKERSHPLARFYETKRLPARETLNSLNALPAAQIPQYADLTKAAERADSLPNGYCRFRNRAGYVHASAPHSGVTGDMLAWLLPWLAGGDDLRFKLTFPGFHAAVERGAAGETSIDLCAMHCTLAVGADLDGAAVAPVRLLFRFEKPSTHPSGVVIPGIIRAGRFTAGRHMLVLTERALHIFLWLGQDVPFLFRSYTREKKLYDAARHCAFLTAHLCGVLPELFTSAAV